LKARFCDPILRHGLQFREQIPVPSFSFGAWMPVDVHRYGRHLNRKWYPLSERPLVGYRLSTLAKVAGKLPEM
jgi:hypothetical protein